MGIIPATFEEFKKTGWKQADVILISGDAYVDHPAFGAAVIARVLEKRGYKVAVIDQPDVNDPASVTVFGPPRLFFGITSGNVDSMLTRYTAFKKIRNDDPFSPDNVPVNRCDRAVIRYCNLVKQNYKESYLVIGGIEASMRRFFHYDYWSNSVRRSILLDSRADMLVFGMGEHAILKIADELNTNKKPFAVSGTAAIQSEYDNQNDVILLDEEKSCIEDKNIFSENFKRIYLNSDKVIVQPVDRRFLVQYPAHVLSQNEIDSVYELPFERLPHPKYDGRKIPAFEMIKFSINSHRGCASGCAFCSIYLHQGRRIISRSEKSILKEADSIIRRRYFTGHITDVGGPSANMYGTVCTNESRCLRISCLFPDRCKYLKTDQQKWISLMHKVKRLDKVKHVTVGSGLRYDLFMRDNASLLPELIEFISGQMKIAPEHTDEKVLAAMRKKPLYKLEDFVKEFNTAVKKKGKKYYIISYFMSNHPGSSLKSMEAMGAETERLFKFQPDQVQSFIPLPMTLSSVIYHTGKDPFTGETVFSEKDTDRKRRQHMLFFKTKGGHHGNGAR
ncbi:MAG: YgiQ family radical SAM protein [Spirochaetes bacterium]|nr:YgiQ family radical SAM protein [Spirochaetota bacterium]